VIGAPSVCSIDEKQLVAVNPNKRHWRQHLLAVLQAPVISMKFAKVCEWFAALHESGCGTSRHLVRCRRMSGAESGPDSDRRF
jgi:hypothetical protein